MLIIVSLFQHVLVAYCWAFRGDMSWSLLEFMKFSMFCLHKFLSSTLLGANHWWPELTMIHVHSNGIDGSNLWRFWRAPGTHSIWIRRGSDVRCARQFSLNGFYGESIKKRQVTDENHKCVKRTVRKWKWRRVATLLLFRSICWIFLPISKMFHELIASWTPPRCTISLGT